MTHEMDLPSGHSWPPTPGLNTLGANGLWKSVSMANESIKGSWKSGPWCYMEPEMRLILSYQSPIPIPNWPLSRKLMKIRRKCKFENKNSFQTPFGPYPSTFHQSRQKVRNKSRQEKRRKQIETNIPQKTADYFSKRITKSDYFLKKSKSKFFCKLNAKTRNFWPSVVIISKTITQKIGPNNVDLKIFGRNFWLNKKLPKFVIEARKENLAHRKIPLTDKYFSKIKWSKTWYKFKIPWKFTSQKNLSSQEKCN